jgi:hypothetical protein
MGLTANVLASGPGWRQDDAFGRTIALSPSGITACVSRQ